jgi:hypothetical protein
LLYLERSSIIARLNAAGYELVREHDLLPEYYFFELKTGT